MGNSTSFKKGEGGRPKGSLNKDKGFINEFLKYLIDGGADKFKSEFNKLEGEKYIKYFLILSKMINEVPIKNSVKANDTLIKLFNQLIKEK